MLLSLLETILVTYLMEQDDASQEKLRLRDNCEDKQEKVQVYDCNTGETQIRDESSFSQKLVRCSRKVNVWGHFLKL